MTCDGLGSEDIEFISDLISSAFLPGNVRLTTLLFGIFLGFIFLTIESPIKIIGESLATLLSLFTRTVLTVDVLFE